MTVPLVLVLLLAASNIPAYAGVDCEAARCAVEAAIEAECPCAASTRHGHHVRCVAQVVRRLAADGTIPAQCSGQVQRCAARSTCGRKPGTVACDRPVYGTCAIGLGLCTHAPILCSSDSDCVVDNRCRIAPSAARCVAGGGVLAPRTNCCPECAPTTPCGPFLICNTAREICVHTEPVGPAVVYSCEPVPAGCEADRTCECAGATLCQGAFDTCSAVARNVIRCECPQCQ